MNIATSYFPVSQAVDEKLKKLGIHLQDIPDIGIYQTRSRARSHPSIVSLAILDEVILLPENTIMSVLEDFVETEQRYKGHISSQKVLFLAWRRLKETNNIKWSPESVDLLKSFLIAYQNALGDYQRYKYEIIEVNTDAVEKKTEEESRCRIAILENLQKEAENNLLRIKANLNKLLKDKYLQCLSNVIMLNGNHWCLTTDHNCCFVSLVPVGVFD